MSAIAPLISARRPEIAARPKRSSAVVAGRVVTRSYAACRSDLESFPSAMSASRASERAIGDELAAESSGRSGASAGQPEKHADIATQKARRPTD
jgi:hypothetical protein